jgi:hypothetical protein
LDIFHIIPSQIPLLQLLSMAHQVLVAVAMSMVVMQASKCMLNKAGDEERYTHVPTHFKKKDSRRLTR